MANETTFQINGNTYKARPLNGFEQMDVASRLGLPLMNVALLKKSKPDADATQLTRTFVATLSQVEKKDMREGVDICMSAVFRQQGASWAPIRVVPQQLMFEDIGLAEMAEIAWRVMEANRLPDFFAVLTDAEGLTIT